MQWRKRLEPHHRREGEPKLPSVAIIGGGVAGLTTAYKLAQQGFKVSVFEASDRLGGRIRTNRDSFSPQHQYCEMGGEWIDSTHKNIMTLARELGLDIQDVTAKRQGDDLYYIGNKFHRPQDFLKGDGTGDYAALAREIGKDRKKATQDIAYAQYLDGQSMDDYLTQAVQRTDTPGWVLDSIRAAYKGQYGIEPAQMSALQLINHIGTGLKMPFAVYGYKQDESRRIKGGNERLIEKLEEACRTHGVEIRTGCALEHVGYNNLRGKPYVYTDFNEDGRQKTRHFDYAVMAMPFSRLREVKGLKELEERKLLSPQKREAIAELGYGNIVKVMLGLKDRPWEKARRLPCPSNGSFRSTNPYLQNCWITTYGQRGNEQENILTVLVAGNEALSNIGPLETRIKKAYAEMLGMKAEDIFNHRHAEQDWAEERFSKGSYSYFKPGQYTRFRTVTGTPEVEGKLGFVGEHTDPELYGYMEGAVSSGLREAERIVAHAKAHPLASDPSKAPAATSR